MMIIWGFECGGERGGTDAFTYIPKKMKQIRKDPRLKASPRHGGAGRSSPFFSGNFF